LTKLIFDSYFKLQNFKKWLIAIIPAKPVVFKKHIIKLKKFFQKSLAEVYACPFSKRAGGLSYRLL